MFKQVVYRPGHPLAKSGGRIRKSRFLLFEKLKGKAGRCHWCNTPLTWEVLCADHLDGNIMNDTPENLVGACRGCNANRDDGTNFGRRKPKTCPQCKKDFIGGFHHKAQVYCSITCSAASRPKTGSKAKHGTRSRYVYGCRCDKCRQANTKAWQKWSHKVR